MTATQLAWTFAYFLSLFLGSPALRAQNHSNDPNSNPASIDLASVTRLWVRQFTFSGNTAFSDADLQLILASLCHRDLGASDLEQARRRVTEHYIQNGHLNSGALIQNQTVANGVVNIQIIEGQLSLIRIEGLMRLSPSYFENRIRHKTEPPLHIPTLEDQLLLLKANPNVATLNAELLPTSIPGESELIVQIRERPPWSALIQARNDRPASVGAEIIELITGHSNLTGHGDPLQLRYGIAVRDRHNLKLSGLDNLGLSYKLPVNVSDGTLEASYEQADYALIEEPFHLLEIESHSNAERLGFRQPLFRTPNSEFAIGLTLERRHSASSLNDEPFSFSPGAVNGQTTSTALRFTQEWFHRSLSQLLALRSTFSWGIDLLDATDDGSHRDGQFAAWLAQAQFVRRLPAASQFMVSSSFQWADDPLLAVEQFSMGGAHTIRGFNENELVRDMGTVSSLEFRLPILFQRTGEPWIQLAPFLDFGTGWDAGQSPNLEHSMASSGIGLLMQLGPRFHGELYWGHPVIRPPGSAKSMSTSAFHFRLSFKVH